MKRGMALLSPDQQVREVDTSHYNYERLNTKIVDQAVKIYAARRQADYLVKYPQKASTGPKHSHSKMPT